MDSCRNTYNYQWNVIAFLNNNGVCLYIVCIYATMFSMGWANGLFGPSLLDLQDRSGVTFLSASTYMTSYDIGYLVGAVVYPFLELKLNAFCVLITTSAILSVSVITLPWCFSYAAIFVICMASGACRSLAIVVSLAEIDRLLGKRRSTYLAILYCFRSMGLIFSPLVLAPFLSNAPYSQSATIPHNDAVPRNSTSMEQTYFFVPFTISSVMVFIEVPIYLFLFVFHIKDKFQLNYELTEDRLAKKLPPKYNVASITMTCVAISQCAAIMSGCFVFVSSFLVQYLNYSRAVGAYATSLNAIFGVLGRLITILTIRYVKHSICLTIHMVIISLASCVLNVCSIYKLHIAAISVCIGVVSFSGFSMLPITVVVFTENFDNLTAKMSSLFVFVEYIGVMLDSVFKGVFMQDQGAFQFVVILIGEVVVCLIGVLALLFLSHVVRGKFSTAENNLLLNKK